jgi:hypothetical protein
MQAEIFPGAKFFRLEPALLRVEHGSCHRGAARVPDSPPIFTLRLSLELAEMPNDPSTPPFTRFAAGVIVFAALAGGSAVALGAWASHGATEPAKGWLTTASTYQLLHALALLATVALRERLSGAARRLAGLALAAFASCSAARSSP